MVPYALWVNAINVEYRFTTYNGKVQKPSVTIPYDLVEGRDYVISYEKEVDGQYQETEPKEVGSYRVAIYVSDNVVIRQAGVSDTEAPRCYYISYSINDDGTGNSGTGNPGTGNPGTGNSGTENPGTGNTGTGDTGTGDNGTGDDGIGNNGTGNSGTGTTATDNGTNHNDSSKEDSDSVAKTGTTSVSANKTKTSSTSYNIKKIKLVSMKKAMKLSWTNVKKAEGYQIQISLYKNFKKAKTTTVKKSKKSYTFKRLKKKKKYYIRIRAYSGKGTKKVYGKWRNSSKKTK